MRHVSISLLLEHVILFLLCCINAPYGMEERSTFPARRLACHVTRSLLLAHVLLFLLLYKVC